jgi:hypothetical protein
MSSLANSGTSAKSVPDSGGGFTENAEIHGINLDNLANLANRDNWYLR